MEIILAFIGSILMLITVCIIGSMILAKDTKEFHIQFSLLKGFDMSGTFFKDEQSRENQGQ